MSGARPPWLDEWLEILYRGVVELPLETAERSRAEQFRILVLLVAAAGLILAGLNAGILAAADMLPASGAEGRPGELWRFIEIVVLLPAGVAALLCAFLYWVFGRRRKDEADHPWRFRATGEDFTVIRSGGERISGPWVRWRFEGYVFGVVRLRRAVYALNLSLDGQPVTIDLKRTHRSMSLSRVVLQRLAAAQMAPAASPPST